MKKTLGCLTMVLLCTVLIIGYVPKHDYKIAEYSDETLCKDIITTLKVLFDIYTAPRKQLIMGVERPGSRLFNDTVVKLLNNSGEFDFEFVCAERDY